jgi:hypothetical protein
MLSQDQVDFYRANGYLGVTFDSCPIYSVSIS